MQTLLMCAILAIGLVPCQDGKKQEDKPKSEAVVKAEELVGRIQSKDAKEADKASAELIEHCRSEGGDVLQWVEETAKKEKKGDLKKKLDAVVRKSKVFTLTISLASPAKAGETLAMKVILKNVSEKAVEVAVNKGWKMAGGEPLEGITKNPLWEASIKDPDGNEVELPECKTQVQENLEFVPLASGKDLDLSRFQQPLAIRLWKPAKAGKYTLTYTLAFREPEGPGDDFWKDVPRVKTVSNKLEIVVK